MLAILPVDDNASAALPGREAVAGGGLEAVLRMAGDREERGAPRDREEGGALLGRGPEPGS